MAEKNKKKISKLDKDKLLEIRGVLIALIGFILLGLSLIIWTLFVIYPEFFKLIISSESFALILIILYLCGSFLILLGLTIGLYDKIIKVRRKSLNEKLNQKNTKNFFWGLLFTLVANFFSIILFFTNIITLNLYFKILVSLLFYLVLLFLLHSPLKKSNNT